MQYHQFLIYIHRPFVSRHTSTNSLPDGPGWVQAKSSCIESAMAISKLLRLYKSAYTLQYANVEVVSIIFSAAIILVFASVSDAAGGRDHRLLTSHLDTCCQALADLGRIFRNATRTLEILLAIKRRWQAKLLVSTGSKRRSSGHSHLAAAYRKKARSQLHDLATQYVPAQTRSF